MTLAVTDRGLAQTATGVSATNTIVSSSFSPTGGAILAVVVACVGQFTSAAPTFTLSDTFTGTGTWTEQATGSLGVGGGYFFRLSAWTAVLGGTPGTGTVTVTRTAGNVDQWLIGDFAEITGQNASPIGATGSLADLTSSTTLTVTLSGAPAASSLVIGGVFDNNGAGSGITPPSSWTELQDVPKAAIGAAYETAYINGSSVTSPQWSAMIADVFGRGGVAVEIVAAGAGAAYVPKSRMHSQAVRRSATR